MLISSDTDVFILLVHDVSMHDDITSKTWLDTGTCSDNRIMINISIS